ncbi:MAG: hypothetical protein DHS80DRAFT_29623 [Piptocephalis tieghemiana]|nr:MAG: hypothetical protein DHS80DRAFT_29623 [Piptocephalis tieghemiana]
MHFRSNSSSSGRKARRPSDFLMERRESHEAAARTAASAWEGQQDTPSPDITESPASSFIFHASNNYPQGSGIEATTNRRYSTFSSRSQPLDSMAYRQGHGKAGSVDGGSPGKSRSPYSSSRSSWRGLDQSSDVEFPALCNLSRKGANRMSLQMDQAHGTGFPGLARDYTNLQTTADHAGACYYPPDRGDGTRTPERRHSGPYHTHPQSPFYQYDHRGESKETADHYIREMLRSAQYGSGEGAGGAEGASDIPQPPYGVEDIQKAHRDIKRGRRRHFLGRHLHLKSVEEKGDAMRQKGEAIVNAVDDGYANVSA